MSMKQRCHIDSLRRIEVSVTRFSYSVLMLFLDVLGPVHAVVLLVVPITSCHFQSAESDVTQPRSLPLTTMTYVSLTAQIVGEGCRPG